MSNETIYTMDCSAIVYPYFATDTINHSFTIEADIDREIDPVLLKEVAQKLVSRYPSLFVRLRKEAFGYKLEHVSDVTPFMMPRPKILNEAFDLRHNENLMRITYENNRLGLEVFHSVTDGSGAISLLKSILAEYYTALGEEIPPCDILRAGEPSKPEEVEDSFRRHYQKGVKNAPRSGAPAFQFCPKGPFDTWHQTEINISAADLKPIAKGKGVSMTMYLVALYLYAFYLTEQGQQSKKPIVMSVPMNLRPIYNSVTLRNFSLYFFASVPQKENVTFDDILENVKRQFAEGTDHDLIQNMIGINVFQQEMPVFKYLPRFGKAIALGIGGKLFGERLSTSTLSNLGVVKLPEPLQSHVSAFRVILGPVPTNHLGICCYCYNGKLSLMVSSRLKSREIEEKLEALLQNDGLSVEVIAR